jgi:hypothetical protein
MNDMNRKKQQRWAVLCAAAIVAVLVCVGYARQERPREREGAEKKNRIGQPVRLLEIPSDLQMPSALNAKVIVPIASLIMRSPAEVSRVLGPPTSKNAAEPRGSHNVLCCYRASAGLQSVRVLFEGGKRAARVTVTFKQPVRRERALRCVGMASLLLPPQATAEGHLVWAGRFDQEEGRFMLEAAEGKRGFFWGVTAEILTQTRAAPPRLVDDFWGIDL